MDFLDCSPNDLISRVKQQKEKFEAGSGDYTKERHQWLEQGSMEDLLKATAASRQAHQSGQVQRGTVEDLLDTLSEEK
jgi:hypothetical protein